MASFSKRREVMVPSRKAESRAISVTHGKGDRLREKHGATKRRWGLPLATERRGVAEAGGFVVPGAKAGLT